ncbi:hypothetical protein BP6252_07794 [Coleophoma cylindrospora]|uniref:Uncharacterized protein n=1 Tax=Coleophoma cylindrospora TaxID=1849047 RepID=A0A3D8RBH6_9HELO|nr:hypothetical protein BP6252_07794 [Coleophoma cylindrospora]
MEQITSRRATGPRSIEQDGGIPNTTSAQPTIFPPFQHEELPAELSDDDDDEVMELEGIPDEDAESLIGPAISRAATRMKSAHTPAAEKAAAMEDVEGGGYFDSDPESPPILQDVQLGDVPMLTSKPNENVGLGLSLGELPPPEPMKEQPAFPSPWQAGPKVMQRTASSQSIMQEAFAKRRSMSGGAETLKKLIPKNLPSMAQARNYFSSAGFGSGQKTPSPSSSPKQSHFPNRTSSRRTAPGSPLNSMYDIEPSNSSSTLRPEKPSPVPCKAASRPNPLRRVTSDDSLLYHSLSRTSSLGDDSRFENHHDQVNSRVKAIRDSLQDRSSFRLPQMPRMLTMPRPSFSFPLNFLSNSSMPPRLRAYTDPIFSDILPGNIAKKITGPPSPVAPAVASGMVAAAVSQPELAKEASGPITHGSGMDVLERAMEKLTGDVVIMGGYRGSILRSAKPPHRQLWVPVKVGLNIRKVNLEVGLDPEDEERMEESIFASGMLQNIGPVDISKRLFKRLRECENAKAGKLRVWDYGYDWRLSPHLLSRKLTAFLEKLPSNQPGSTDKGALVIAHSLGGLITRHVCNQKPELFSGIIYAGVPQSCINILGPFRNGDAVLLSSRVLTAQVNFTLRTSFLLLPEDSSCFVDIKTKEKYPVDFMDPDEWIKYRLSPCTDPPLPPYSHNTGALGSLLNLSGSLLSLPTLPSLPSLPVPGKKNSNSGLHSPPKPTHNGHREPNSPTFTTRAADVIRGADGGKDRTLAPQMGNSGNPVSKGHNNNTSVSTAVTIPRDKAIAYLRRTLAETKKFKQELYFNPAHSAANRYPPLATIYGKSIPTCCGAKVHGRESIPCSDVYDNLAFASGDGVCLAKEAMLPEGYLCAKGGRIRSDRGHVTLLGDLNAVGRGILAVQRGREKGIGLGTSHGVGGGA